METVVGRREEVGSGFAGRCSAGVWHLVGMGAMALSGFGGGLLEGKVGICEKKWKTNTCPGPVPNGEFPSIFVGLSRVKAAAGGAIFRKSILPPFRASGGRIRRENGFSVLKSICWCNWGAF